MGDTYLFKSERLGFRNWREADIAPMAAINADADVMEFFPAAQSLQETRAFIGRMQQQMADKGYCYFAVDKLEDGKFIGFIGLSMQTFQSDFTPCVDVGWRLSKEVWGRGYATEGAKRCLQYAFDALGIEKVCSMCPKVNLRSEHVMKKVGMARVSEFIHPKLADDVRLRDCVLYEMSRL